MNNIQEQNLLLASTSTTFLEGASSEDAHSPLWKPDGSVFAPETFRDLLRRKHDTSMSFGDEQNAGSILSVQGVNASCNNISDCAIASVDLNYSNAPADSTDLFEPAAVPTIMLSNSTAAVPLSFESSLSIAPLAARRGRKVPAPLELSPTTFPPSNGLYPGIPTPFLGSPSTYSPRFEFSQNPMGFSMDLAAMCQDLRSRCPPLHPLSPAATESFSRVDPLLDSDLSSSSSNSSNMDFDDWAFANDILAKHVDFTPQDVLGPTTATLVSNSGTPSGHLEQGDSYSWSSSPTLTGSPGTDDSSEPSTPEQVTKVDPDVQQRRRRTVIIETPHNNSIKPARITMDLSHLADDSPDTSLSSHFNEPVPVEVFNVAERDSFVESTPNQLRPISNATIKMPIRSILKTREKKRVRFSLMPGMEGDEEEDEKLSCDFQPEFKGKKRIRASTTPNCRPENPFRPRSESADEFASQRASFPRHPAVKAFKRQSSVPVPDVSPTPASRRARQSMPLVPRVVDKSEVGPPKKLTGSIARRSMPVVDVKKKKDYKRGGVDENEGRRFSEGVKMGQKSSSPLKNRVPFRAILTKWRS